MANNTLKGLRSDKTGVGKMALADYLNDHGTSEEAAQALAEARLVPLVEEGLKIPYRHPDVVRHVAGDTHLLIHVCASNTSFALLRYVEATGGDFNCIRNGVECVQHVVCEFGRRRGVGDDTALTARKVRETLRHMQQRLDYYEDPLTPERYRNPEQANLLRLTLADLRS